jgi:transcriptional regulator, tetR family
MRTGGEKTRERILREALKLFTTEQYDQVTYSDLEKATGLSRGAILYHIKNKEKLFRDVLGAFVYKNNTLTALDESKRETLRETIDNFMDQLAKEQKYWRKFGIANINFALLNIQMSAYTTFPDVSGFAREWYQKEIAIWREVIERAVANGEIRRVDPLLFAELFEDTYFGTIYAALPTEEGYNIERVRHKLHCLYDTIKA